MKRKYYLQVYISRNIVSIYLLLLYDIYIILYAIRQSLSAHTPTHGSERDVVGPTCASLAVGAEEPSAGRFENGSPVRTLRTPRRRRRRSGRPTTTAPGLSAVGVIGAAATVATGVRWLARASRSITRENVSTRVLFFFHFFPNTSAPHALFSGTRAHTRNRRENIFRFR